MTLPEVIIIIGLIIIGILILQIIYNSFKDKSIIKPSDMPKVKTKKGKNTYKKRKKK